MHTGILPPVGIGLQDAVEAGSILLAACQCRRARGHGVRPCPIALAIRSSPLPALIRRERLPPGRSSGSRTCSPGCESGEYNQRDFLAAGAPGIAPSDPADPPATRVDRGNALFSSLKPNRGERIRTFDFLVPNQAL